MNTSNFVHTISFTGPASMLAIITFMPDSKDRCATFGVRSEKANFKDEYTLDLDIRTENLCNVTLNLKSIGSTNNCDWKIVIGDSKYGALYNLNVSITAK